MKYLDENYTDIDLNISKLSEQFGYVPSYISKMFKECMDVGIIDYLNRKRVDEVKRLLIHSNLILQEISEQTGFYSVASLIRVFKKYERTTPGNYKRQFLEQDGGNR